MARRIAVSNLVCVCSLINIFENNITKKYHLLREQGKKITKIEIF